MGIEDSYGNTLKVPIVTALMAEVATTGIAFGKENIYSAKGRGGALRRPQTEGLIVLTPISPGIHAIFVSCARAGTGTKGVS